MLMGIVALHPSYIATKNECAVIYSSRKIMRKMKKIHEIKFNDFPGDEFLTGFNCCHTQ